MFFDSHDKKLLERTRIRLQDDLSYICLYKYDVDEYIHDSLGIYIDPTDELYKQEYERCEFFADKITKIVSFRNWLLIITIFLSALCIAYNLYFMFTITSLYVMYTWMYCSLTLIKIIIKLKYPLEIQYNYSILKIMEIYLKRSYEF